MSDYKKCPHCGDMLDLTHEVRSNTNGKVHFCSWLCRSCGVRQETRRIGAAAEEILLTSQPRAVIDAAETSRMMAETEGHLQFQSVGGRRNVERKHA